MVRNVRKSRSPFARTARKGRDWGKQREEGRDGERERETTKESIKGEKKESPVYGVTYAHAEPS